jgi:hypothetical protein
LRAATVPAKTPADCVLTMQYFPIIPNSLCVLNCWRGCLRMHQGLSLRRIPAPNQTPSPPSATAAGLRHVSAGLVTGRGELQVKRAAWLGKSGDALRQPMEEY